MLSHYVAVVSDTKGVLSSVLRAVAVVLRSCRSAGRRYT